MNTWITKKIEDAVHVVMGQSPPSSSYNENGIGLPFFQGKAEFTNKYASPRKWTTESKKKIKPESIIISVRAPVGDVNIVKNESSIGRGLAGLETTENDRDFIFFSLIHNKQAIESLGYGSTFKAINKSQLHDFELYIPPIKTQKKISYILSTIQNKIENIDKQIETYTSLKKSVMEKLFTEGLSGEKQKETEIGMIPESWEVVKFEELCVLQRGKDLAKSKFKKGKIPVAGSNGIIGFHNEARVFDGGVTVGRSGSTGKVNYYNQDFWPHNTVLFVKDFKKNHKKFIYYYLEYIDLSRYTSGVSVPTLNRNSFSSIKVIKPTIDEQIEMARSISELDSKIVQLSYKLNLHKDLFNSLLQKLMNQEIEVDDIDLKM